VATASRTSESDSQDIEDMCEEEDEQEDEEEDEEEEEEQEAMSSRRQSRRVPIQDSIRYQNPVPHKPQSCKGGRGGRRSAGVLCSAGEEWCDVAMQSAAASQRGSAVSSTSAPAPKDRAPRNAGNKIVAESVRIETRLRVDPETGAGLALCWCQGKGYAIADVEPYPGHKDLQAGDVIVSIDGLRLDDAGSEVEVEQRFGSRFHDGARLIVKRSSPQCSSRAGEGDSAAGIRSRAVLGSSSGSTSTTFSTKIQVQRGVGAGLVLIWLQQEGYLVEAVESRPGQPALQPGDVLRIAGGKPLGMAACHSTGKGKGSSPVPCEAQAEEVMASALHEGAFFEVFRPKVDTKAGDLVLLASSVAGPPLWIPSVGVGTWSWGSDMWGHQALPSKGSKHREVQDLPGVFNGALDVGCFFFDTAPTYGHGVAEETLGRMCHQGRYAAVATKHFPRARDRDLAKAMLATARNSATRLQLEGPIDLFQLHKPADPPVSLEAQADALAAVVQAGAARTVGVCNFSLEELRTVHARLLRAHGIRLSTCQVELSLLRQLPVTSGLVAGCHELGVVVLAYSPLAMGRLSGKYHPEKGLMPKWGKAGDEARPFGGAFDTQPEAGAALLAALRGIGQHHGGRTPAQVALNWVLCQGVVALAGARSSAQAQENAGAIGWRMSPAEVDRLAALGAQGSLSDFQHG